MRLLSKERKTASYRIVPTKDGNRYEFYCDLSGALVCTTNPVKRENQEVEQMFIWETEAKNHFNRCHKCDRWVIDAMFNPEVLNCVKCSPFEAFPNYCPGCGVTIENSMLFCPKCGIRLMYGGESDDDDGKD